MSTCETCGRELPRCSKCGAGPWQAKRAYLGCLDLLIATCQCGHVWPELPLDRQEQPPTPTREEVLAEACRALGVDAPEETA